jgi:hypothetical protein
MTAVAVVAVVVALLAVAVAVVLFRRRRRVGRKGSRFIVPLTEKTVGREGKGACGGDGKETSARHSDTEDESTRGITAEEWENRSRTSPSGRMVASPSKKRYVAFLSHYKTECAMEARFLNDALGRALGGEDKLFLDSDNLKDLRKLLDEVRDSDCLLLIQSSGLLSRPWCLLEMYTAVEANVPIVTINVKG